MNKLHPLASQDRRVLVKFVKPTVVGDSGLMPAALTPEMSHLPDLTEMAQDFPIVQPAIGSFDEDDLADIAPGFQTFSPRSDWSAVR